MQSSSHSTLADDLGRRIVNGEILPGTTMTLAALEEEYDASRTMIREVIRVLEARNLVTSRRRVGITVSPPAEWSAFDSKVIEWSLTGSRRDRQIELLNELRVAIEPIAGRLSADRATPEQKEALLKCAEIMTSEAAESRGNSERFFEADVEFHRILLSASDNPMLASISGAVAGVLTMRHEAGLTPAVPSRVSILNHSLLAEAISRGDSEAAEVHARAYTDSVLAEVAQVAQVSDPEISSPQAAKNGSSDAAWTTIIRHQQV